MISSLATVLVAAAFAGSSPAPSVPDPAVRTRAGAVSSAAGYRAPIAGPLRIVRGFHAPPTPYAAGHRGVDLAASSGTTVVSAGPGVVTFAGLVAGRGVVVIAHQDEIATEYEPLSPLVRRGDPVDGSTPIGRVSGSHDGCGTDCLHWGARRGGRYFDPLTLLQALGVVRLVPWTS